MAIVSNTKAILAALKNKKDAEAGVPPKITAEGLAQLWVREVAKLPESKGCLPPVSMKEKGHFGRLALAWGEKAPNIIRAAVRDWVAFAKEVADAKGLKNFPTRPLVGFLYTHLAAAEVFSLNAANCTEVSAKVVVSVPALVQSPPVVTPLKKAKQREVPMTYEELQEILRGG